MEDRITRRLLLARAGSATIVSLVGLGGCGNDPVHSAGTPTLKRSKLPLRAFQVISASIGERLFSLPHPASRIVGVVLITASVGAELLITYIDAELAERQVSVKLTDDEKMKIEKDQSVTFVRDDGKEQKVELGPNQYDDSK